MTWFDALLGKIRNAGTELELGAGLNFTGSIQAAANAVTGFVDVTLASVVSFTRATLNGLVLPPSAACVISGGAVSVPGGFSIVDTEGLAATDNLDTISGSFGGVAHPPGTIVILAQNNSSRDVTITHGVGNIKTWKGTSIALGNRFGLAVLVYVDSEWRCVGSYSDATAASLAVQALAASGAISAASASFTGLATCGALRLDRSPSAAVIASGAIPAPTYTFQLVDTEGSAATDDLDTITATGITNGQLLILRAFNSSRDVTIRDSSVSGGNIETPSGASLVLDDATKFVLLIKDISSWHVIGRGNT